MRVFALSDLHVDFPENLAWVRNLSTFDYVDDVLALCGDISDLPGPLHQCFDVLARRFRAVCFVPGNHDLWVFRNQGGESLSQFERVQNIAEQHGFFTTPWHSDGIAIVPLLGWYDYSFGSPSEWLREHWSDYFACAWPGDMTDPEITEHFCALNTGPAVLSSFDAEVVVSCSHFLPRIDVLPPQAKRYLDPVLGTTRLEQQLRGLGADIHIYGHSHINRRVDIDGVTYVNAALGYPRERTRTRHELVPVVE